MRVGCVILSTGERPDELQAAVASAERQRGVEVTTVVVWNTETPGRPPAGRTVRCVGAGRNLGIPAGRNLGVQHLPPCELLLFLDDDAVLGHDEVLARAAARFAADPRLAVVTMRLVDPVTGETSRRHVPRLRVGDPRRSSYVTTFLGGACVIGREAFERAGGLPGGFFYAHEETSLAWRLLDLGYRLRYEGDLVIEHPVAPPARHARYHHLTARNRVLLARMHLPIPVAVVYLLVWAALTLLRERGGLVAAVRGAVAGFRETDIERRPMRWGTVLRMARYGRPPII
jgi:GT2 family glycosyltransferase